jgi:lipopolysaccharide export system permease protein
MDVVRLFACLLPNFFILTLPTALLLGVLLTFSRIHADNELYALKAAGMSLYRLLPPVYLFGSVVAALSLLLTTWAGPRATQGFQSIFISMATQNVFFGMKERVFFDGLPGHVIYIEHLDSEQESFEGIFIKDQNFPGGEIYYFAREGRILGDKLTGKIFMELKNGTLQRRDPGQEVFQFATFERYWLQIDLSRFFASDPDKEPMMQELTLGELDEKIRETSEKGEDTRKLLLNYHQRFSMPLGTLVFCTLAIPLSLISQRSVRYTGFSLSIAVVLFYYVFMQLGNGLILAGKIPVMLGAWLPNIVMGTLGVYLLWKKAEEKPTRILDRYAAAIQGGQDLLRRLTRRGRS